jgi:N6-adenosine-specific RNA methylase IME4
MTLEEIISMKDWLNPMIEEQAHLWMWCINPLIQDALTVIDAWGFRYVNNMVWVKNHIGLGYYFRGQHELLLFARKGKPMERKIKNISSIVFADKRKHSQKPRQFYDIIEKISYPPYIELFARNTHTGWDSWGNEVKCSIKELF